MKRFFLIIAMLFVMPGLAWGTAETLTSTHGSSTFPVYGSGMAGTVKVAYGTYDIAAVVEAGDIFEMCRIPAGATVIGGWFTGDDIDTGTETLELDVGWAANGVESLDADGFGDLGVITGDAITDLKAAASIYYPLQKTIFTDGPKSFSAETVIQITAVAASHGGHTGTISLVILYTMD